MDKGRLTLVTATRPATLGKRFALKPDGTLEKTTAGELIAGRYELREFRTVHDLAALLESVGTDQAVMATLPKDGSDAGTLATRKTLKDYPGALARTKEHFGFPEGQAGVVALDYDPAPGQVPMAQSDLWALLMGVVPAAADAGVLWWRSGSSCIFHGERELQGLRGQRLYLLVDDLADTVRFSETLAAGLWLAGHGRVLVSESGQKLIRCVFDDAMAQPARLDFCGGAVCEAPLEQRRGAPVVLANGGFLDTRAALPDLTRDEAQRVDSLHADAREKAEPEARAKREAWKAARLQAGVARLVAGGCDYAAAHERTERSLSSALGGVLLGDYVLTLEDGREITVGQALDDRDRYHGALTLDPLEPEYLGGKVTGKLYLFGAAPTLHSFAHGGATYRLRRQPHKIYVTAGRRADVADEIRRRLAEEEDVFLRGGVLVRFADGKLIPIRRGASLAYLVGSRFALYRKGAKGEDVPVDLDEATANMVLASLGVQS